jgi:hypothetical protein
MKNILHFLYLLLFGAGLGAGIYGSLFIPVPELSSRPVTPTPVEETRLVMSANGQRSVLLLMLDDLTLPEPTLQSAWLLLYVPSHPRITILPVFPSPSSGNSAFNEEVQKTFQLIQVKGSYRLDSSFEEVLHQEEINWGGYILLDQPGLAAISQSLQRADNLYNLSALPGRKSPGGENQSKPLLSVQDQKLTALVEEAYFYRNLCLEATRLGGVKNKDLPQVVEAIIPNHMSVSFYLNDLEGEFFLLRTHGKDLFCEFPTLNLNSYADAKVSP